MESGDVDNTKKTFLPNQISVGLDLPVVCENGDGDCNSALIHWEHVNIETDWGTIRGKSCGKGKRKILAVHGWLDNANSFDLIAPYIYKYCTFLSIDMPGHGWSDHFGPGFIYNRTGYIGAIKKVVQKVGWKKFTYMGHSMGAVLGIFYTAVFPEDVETLISIDIIKPWSLKPKDYAETFRKNLLNYFKNEEYAKQPPIEYPEQELMEKTVQGISKSLDEASARILMERSTRVSRCGKKRILTRDLRAKAYFIGFISFEAWYDFARSIKCPILIVKVSRVGI